MKRTQGAIRQPGGVKIFRLAALGATSFVIAFSGAVMPGPLLTITIGESVKRGARAGPLIIVGHAILEGVLVALLLGGLASLFAAKWFALTSFFLGGAILILMGWSMVRESRTVDIDAVMEGETPSGNIILLGIIGSLLICVVLYCGVALVMTGMVRYDKLSADASLAQVFVDVGKPFYATMIVVQAVIIMLLGTTRFLGPKGRHAAILVSALTLAGLGLYRLAAGVLMGAGA